MIFGEMATTHFLRPAGRWWENCINICRNLALFIVGWLAGLLGMRLDDQKAKLLPDGCRAIPAGHFNFDPDMVDFFGGKDALNKAVIYQRFMAWIESNRLAGRNMRDGQAYSWNTYEQWAADIRIFHPKTIQKHVKVFEAMGLLSSQQPNKRDGDCTKHYTSPLRLSDNLQQMLPGWEHKTPRVGAKDSDLLTTQYPATHKPSTRKAKTPATPARASRFKTAGGVAIFPNHIPDVEPVERKAEIPEQRPASDEHEQFTSVDKLPTIPGVYPPPLIPRSPSPTGDEPTEEETQSSGNTPEIDVPEWMPSFFTGCAPDELVQLLHRFTEPVLLDAKKYAENPANRIDNPPGYVRVQLARGWRPPVGQAAKSYHQDWMDDSYAYKSSEYLQWVVSDECPFLPSFKADAQKILEARESEGV